MNDASRAFEEIVGSPDPPMTVEQAEAEWQKFLALAPSLIGKTIRYGCLGGDMYKVEATVTSITPTPDRVTIGITDAMQSPEGDDVPEAWEPFPFSELQLDRRGEPPSTNRNIVLPATVEPMDVSLEIGFIF